MIFLLAPLASIAVVAGLGMALYGWFKVSLYRFHGVVANDVLSRWDAQLAELSELERDQERAQPPVEVLDAIWALPSARPRRFQLN